MFSGFFYTDSSIMLISTSVDIKYHNIGDTKKHLRTHIFHVLFYNFKYGFARGGIRVSDFQQSTYSRGNICKVNWPTD